MLKNRKHPTNVFPFVLDEKNVTGVGYLRAHNFPLYRNVTLKGNKNWYKFVNIVRETSMLEES